MKEKNFIIDLVIYPFDLMVSVGQTDDELKAVFKKFHIVVEDHMWQFDGPGGRGRFCFFESNQGFIRLRKRPITPDEYGTLQHEIFHYVAHFLHKLRMPWHPKNDEAHAYLIGYITEQIYKRLKK